MHRTPQIIIVGGGAGGLELAVALGRTVGKVGQAEIILVNDSLTHIWKPLLHEIAAGTLNSHEDELNFFALAKQNHFHFELGRITQLNRQQKTIQIETDFQTDSTTIFKRNLHFDILVLAIGSISNDFGTPGVQQNCIILDSREQAERFHQQFLQHLLQAQADNKPSLDIAIIGGGATGVELAAELDYAAELCSRYGLDRLQTKGKINIHLIEASPRLLAQLPEAISQSVTHDLTAKNIQVLTGERVSEVTADGIETQSGHFIKAQLKVWAAGIKGHNILAQLDGLATNKANQLQVKETLQTTLDDTIFAIGDCAACPQPNSDRPVPPRAQAASQEAALLAKSLLRYLKGESLLKFRYRDYGSLITLSKNSVVGQLMTAQGLKLGVEGKLAHWLYEALYKRHQIRVMGWWRTIMRTIANLLAGRNKPRLKLH